MKYLLVLFLCFFAYNAQAQLGLNLPNPINKCETSVPADGFEVFNLRVRESEIIQPVEDYTFTYHPTSGDALGGANAFPNPEAYTNMFTPQLIFIRVRRNSNNVSEITNVEIAVVDEPAAEALPENIFIDDGNGDGLGLFDLTVNEPGMIGSQDPFNYTFGYFLTEPDCTADTNPIANPTAFQNFENPQTIYVQMRFVNSDCFVCFNFQIEADGVLGTAQQELQQFIMYPNPAKDILKVEINTVAFERILIRDLQGRTIKNLEGQAVSQEINISALPKGVYFLTAETSENSTTQKFIKE